MNVMSQLPTWKSGRNPTLSNHGTYDFILVYTGLSYKVDSAEFFAVGLSFFCCRASLKLR